VLRVVVCVRRPGRQRAPGRPPWWVPWRVALPALDGASLAVAGLEGEAREACEEGVDRHLASDRRAVDPRGQPGRGGPDSRQDRRERSGEPNAAGADVPLELR